MEMGSYNSVLDATEGVMEEFVNPKYTDGTKTKFKKPTRLECMMQDYAKVMTGTHGFCSGATWLCYSPCKNSLSEAAGKITSGVLPYCASSAERDM
jgi:UDP-sugar pyrophosphorylase